MSYNLSDSTNGIRRLCVVIPVHNEADNVGIMVQRLAKVAAKLVRWELEVLFVDDGSTDQSVNRLRELRASGVGVGFLRLSRNYGHQAALNAGMQSATGDAVITLDADLQHPPEEIPRMIAAYEAGADVVQMVRSDPAGNTKGLFSTWFYRCFNHLSDTKLVPNASDFRLVSRQVLDVLVQMPEREKFLRGLIPSLGFNQTTLEYDEASRLHGTPTYTFKASLKLARKALFDFSTVPLKMVFWLGLSIAVMSFCFGLMHIAIKLARWDKVEPGFTDLISAIFFLSGCTLASLGILGRYLIMILEQLRGRPAFVVMDYVRGVPLKPAASIPESAVSVRVEDPATRAPTEPSMPLATAR